MLHYPSSIKDNHKWNAKYLFNLSVITSEWERDPPGAENVLPVILVIQLFEKV